MCVVVCVVVVCVVVVLVCFVCVLFVLCVIFFYFLVLRFGVVLRRAVSFRCVSLWLDLLLCCGVVLRLWRVIELLC